MTLARCLWAGCPGRYPPGRAPPLTPVQTTPEGVREYFSQFGDVAEVGGRAGGDGGDHLLQVMVMKDPATRRSRGFGFITFTQAGSVSKVRSIPVVNTTFIATDQNLSFWLREAFQ